MGSQCSKPALYVMYKGKSHTIKMSDFKHIKTVGDFLHHMKIGHNEWVVIEVTNGFVLDYVYEGSPFRIREMILVSPSDERRRITMTAAYRDSV